MPSCANEQGKNRIFLCWSCAQGLYAKLTHLKIVNPPDKKYLLSQAFRIASKPKQETF